MRVSHTDILMMEAFLDGELASEDVLKIKKVMEEYPELHQLYNLLKMQKKAIKDSFLSNGCSH